MKNPDAPTLGGANKRRVMKSHIIKVRGVIVELMKEEPKTSDHKTMIAIGALLFAFLLIAMRMI